MPSSMLHLMAAKQYKYESNALFLLGSLAPDCVDDWVRKDALHLRRSNDRETDLIKLFNANLNGDLFSEAIVLHLYLDWKWDVSFLMKFMTEHGENWVHAYRNEIGLLSAYFYNQLDWSRCAWTQMLDYSEGYGNDDYSGEDIRKMVERNYNWHENNLEVFPQYFSPNDVVQFVNETVAEYKMWSNKNRQ